MSDPRLKPLKIRTGVVKRLCKELSMYQKEATDLAVKVEKLVEAKEDEYVIRKQREVLEESKAMTPDTRNRLTKAIHDLKSELVTCEGDLNETKEFTEAKDALAAAEKQIGAE